LPSITQDFRNNFSIENLMIERRLLRASAG
jgi:hypothetical protein